MSRGFFTSSTLARGRISTSTTGPPIDSSANLCFLELRADLADCAQVLMPLLLGYHHQFLGRRSHRFLTHGSCRRSLSFARQHCFHSVGRLLLQSDVSLPGHQEASHGGIPQHQHRLLCGTHRHLVGMHDDRSLVLDVIQNVVLHCHCQRERNLWVQSDSGSHIGHRAILDCQQRVQRELHTQYRYFYHLCIRIHHKPFLLLFTFKYINSYFSFQIPKNPKVAKAFRKLV